jgi:AraC-like DNA-binding protein
LDLTFVGIPEIPVFGRYEYTSAQQGLQPHAHPDCVEICYLHRGEQTYRVLESDFKLVGGDVFITFPGEVHSTGNKPEDRGVLYWLNLRLPPKGESLLELSAVDTRTLLTSLTSLPQRHFAGTPAMRSMLENVLALASKPNSPLQRLSIRNYLVRYLLDVITCSEMHQRVTPSSAIAKIAENIRSTPEKDSDLDDLASRAQLSLSRFKVRFKSEMGIAPRDFILRVKVDAAKGLLSNSTLAVTDISFNLGFSSSQYFATVFKRYTGQTPLEYRTGGPTIQLRRA